VNWKRKDTPTTREIGGSRFTREDSGEKINRARDISIYATGSCVASHSAISFAFFRSDSHLCVRRLSFRGNDRVAENGARRSGIPRAFQRRELGTGRNPEIMELALFLTPSLLSLSLPRIRGTYRAAPFDKPRAVNRRVFPGALSLSLSLSLLASYPAAT